MTTTEAPSALAAREVVRALVAHGVEHVVLAPGSRSAPLAYALHAADDAGWLRLHVRVDERVAAFVALGIARGGGRPTAVVTTSGTAVANLHPAVLEASHAGVPLVVLTADRPHEMRGTGANQTTDQVGIFGTAVRWSADVPAGSPGGPQLRQLVTRALAAAEGRRTYDPGPVHLNLAFRDPLTPLERWVPGQPPGRHPVVAPMAHPEPVELAPQPRTVVVAGDGAGPGARALAEAGRWPLLAEPTSMARAGRNAVPGYQLVLGVPELTADAERVVVVGHPTLSRPVSALLARPDLDVVVVAPTGPWTDVAGVAGHVVPAATVGEGRPTDEEWLDRWRRAGRAAADVLADRLDARAEGALAADPAGGGIRDGLVVAREVATRSTGHTLVLGSSSTVRDMDLAAPPPPDDPLRAFANRGLAGIDGTVSTATGIALATGRPVRAVMGDLTFLHDAGGLLRGALEADVDLQVVVLNDVGGSLFAHLEHGAPERAVHFERVFGTPQDVDLGLLAAGYGARHRVVGTRPDLRAVLDAPVRGRSVVEIRLDRREVRGARQELGSAVRRAVRAVLR